MNILNLLNITFFSMFANSALAVDIQNFINSLKYMGIGMLCIFVVMLAIIVVVYVLNKVTNSISAKKKAKEENNN